MPEPYTYEDIEMGIVNKEAVRVAYMPRADFLELVDDLLEEFATVATEDDGLNQFGEAPVNFTDRLRPVAETMPTFPMSTWIHPKRGCGCVVGEYLVAANIINREEFAPGHEESQPNLAVLIEHQEDGRGLNEFGYQIDRYVRMTLLRGRMRDYMEFSSCDSRAVVFID